MEKFLGKWEITSVDHMMHAAKAYGKSSALSIVGLYLQ